MLGLILLFVMSGRREGVDDTLTMEPQCPSGMTLEGELCRKDHGPGTMCPSGQPPENGFCMQSDGNGGTSGVGALCAEGTKINGKCISTRPPNCPSGYVFETGGLFGTYKCITTAAAARNRAYEAEQAALAAEPVAPRPTGSTSSSYTPIPVAVGGALPTAIDARSSNTDSARSSSTTGDVFEEGGPFSGPPGTGQGTGAGAAGPLNGNSTYGPPGTTTTIDPIDFWPGTRNSGTAPRAPAGNKQPVGGPTFGGTGVSLMSGSGKTPRSEPALYGPSSGDQASRFGFGSSQKNSQDTSMLPSFGSAGSEPENQYAVTSRVPGDQDIFAPGFAQSSSYSLANSSMKTNPVPFLADFSAFQN